MTLKSPNVLQEDNIFPIYNINYGSDNESFLNNILSVLKSSKKYNESLLFRSLESKYLYKVSMYGTDRAELHAPRDWELKENWNDFIYASTEKELWTAIKTEPFGTAFDIIDSMENPSVVVYNAVKFTKRKSNEDAAGSYKFLETSKKLEAVVCAFRAL